MYFGKKYRYYAQFYPIYPNMRQVYIISDLHIGGAASPDPRQRGFRLCTHTDILANFINSLAVSDEATELVINGDMVDFLAEEPFEVFTESQRAASAKLLRIINREQAFFDALRHFLRQGHSLTILTGNHDIELTLPEVRQLFERTIAAQGKKYRFITDGEAYTIGKEVIIEHGDQYDAWNKIDHSGLLLLRKMQSRRELLPAKLPFVPPKGSALVRHIINPLKKQYQFIDLLKPENEAVLPILLALEPNLRSKIVTLLGLSTGWTNANSFDPPTDTTERHITEPTKRSRKINTQKLINDELRHVLSEEDLKAFNRATPELEKPAEMTETQDRGWFDTYTWASGLLSLLTQKDDKNIKKRLPALLKALRVLQNDRSFDVSQESLREYETAARHLVGNGYKYVIMGHTHFARRIPLNDAGAIYFNCGTWADLMRFPKAIFSGNDQDALAQLNVFIDQLLQNQLQEHLVFLPTYVHINLDDNEMVSDIALMEYEG